MAPESRVFVTGPDVVRSVTGEDVDMASLGGRTPTTRSPVCATSSPTTSSTPTSVAAAWSDVLPAGPFRPRKAEAGDTDLHALLPDSARRAYDVHP